jgi:hypothetical protein
VCPENPVKEGEEKSAGKSLLHFLVKDPETKKHKNIDCSGRKRDPGLKKLIGRDDQN